MSTSSTEAVTDNSTLVDDIVLHEDDLTDEAKRQFEYHTKILNMFEQNRRFVLENDQLSPLGRHLLLSHLEKTHGDCKRVLNYVAANRELINGSLPTFGPLVICGLARTGSTLLYNLLACDPDCRAPRVTDTRIECVPPISRSNVIERERRMLIAKQYKELHNELKDRPTKYAASHPWHDVEEDLPILTHAGVHLVIRLAAPLDQSEPSRFFFDKTNKDCVYAYHETFLRMLNSVDPPSSHWLLKCPLHTFFLDALLEKYPHAALIMTHRSLEEVLPSVCRLCCTLDYHFDETNSTAQQILKARALEDCDKLIECIVEFRGRQNDKHDQVRKNICDVSYDELMKDPISMVHRIYDHFGLHWSHEFKMAMEAWLRDNPQGKQGRNAYSLSDFDLTQKDIDTRYVAYIDLFLRPSSSSQSSSDAKDEQ